MLGNTATKEFFKSADVIQMNSNVWAEWNYNNIFQPFAVSTRPFTFNSNNQTVTPKLPEFLTASWTPTGAATLSTGNARPSINSAKIIPTSHYFLSGSAGANVSTKITLGTSQNNDTLTASYSFATTKNGFYKLVFFISKDPVAAYQSVKAINTSSVVATGTGTSSYTYVVQSVGAYGNTSDISNSNQVTVTNGSLNNSVYNTISWQKLDKNAVAYKVYRVSGNTYSLLTTTTQSSYVDKVNKISAKQDDYSPFTTDVFVTPSIKLFNTSLEEIDCDYYVRISNTGNGKLERNNSTIRVNGKTWQKVEVYFTNKNDVYRQIKKINIILNVYSPIYNQSFSITPLWLYDISEFDYFNNDIFPGESVFSSRRPGEGLLNPFISYMSPEADDINLYTDKINSSDPSRYISYSYYNPQNIHIPGYSFQLIPSKFNKYKYYISEELSSTVNAGFAGIAAFYDQYLTVNKIIVKSNEYVANINSNSGSLTLYFNTANGTASSIVITGPFSFDNNGISIFYYANGAWANKSGIDFAEHVKTAASAGSMSGGGWLPPSIQDNGQIPTNSIFDRLTGISFISKAQYTSNVAQDNQEIFRDNRMHLIEISPRLEIDVTGYLLGYSFSKNLGKSETGLPLGYISSNDASIEINNFPVIYNEKPFSIFENKSQQTTFYDLLKQGVKFTSYFWSPVARGDFSQIIPAFTMYSDSWKISDVDSVAINLYDAMKHYAMSTESNAYYAKGENLFTIISHTLELAGFSDYSKKELKKICENKTNTSYFWTNEDRTVFEALQNLFIAHQIGAYIDEIGFLRFIDTDIISYKKNSNVSDFSLSDTSHTYWTYDPNIILSSYNETISPKIGKVIINYKIPNTSISPSTTNKYYNDQVILERTQRSVFNEETDAGLGYTYLTQQMNTQDNVMYIEDFSNFARRNPGRYSGTFFVGGEAIKIEGLEYIYSCDTVKTQSYIIKNEADRQEALADYTSMAGSNKVTETITNKCVGITRGMYGTTIKPHKIYTSKDGEILSDFTFSNPAGYNVNADGLIMIKTSDNTKITPKEKALSTYNHFSMTFRSVSVKENHSIGFYYTTRSAVPIKVYLTCPGEKENTIMTFAYGEGTTSTGIGFYKKANSSDGKEFSINLNTNLFDNQQHRFDFWIEPGVNAQEYIISYRIDDESITRINIFNPKSANVDVSLMPAAGEFGFFGSVSNYVNKKSSNPGIMFVILYELYACNWPSGAYSNDLSIDLIGNPKYHFQTKSFLDKMITTNSYIDSYEPNYFLWQNKPSVIGFKHYNGEKFISSPAVPDSFECSFAGYDLALSATELKNGGFYSVDSQDLALSTPYATPFLFEQVVVNNTRTIPDGKYGSTLLFLNARNGSLPAGGGNSITVTPYDIEAEALNFTTDKKIERVINSSFINNSVQIISDWIQDEKDAERIIEKIADLLPTFNSEVNISIFGNPLIQVGDVVQLWYKLKGIGFDSSGNASNGTLYFVDGVNHDWDGGLKTSLSLKQLS